MPKTFLIDALKITPFEDHVFFVGGAVRVEILGFVPKDFDLVVDMDKGAEDLTWYLHNKFPNIVSKPRQLGHFPIWQVSVYDELVEVADTMDENNVFCSLKEDVLRRDFSVNSLLKNLKDELIDLTGSLEDIKKGVLKIHSDKVFDKDSLRLLRLIRFCAKFGFKIPLSVLRLSKKEAHKITNSAPERIIEEFKKIAVTGNFYKAIKLMKIIGLLKHLLPEIGVLKTTEHDARHSEGCVLKHTLLVMSHSKPTLVAQLAALFHDVGKPATQNTEIIFFKPEFVGTVPDRKNLKVLSKEEVKEGIGLPVPVETIDRKISFIDHEDIGADITRATLERLKFDNDTTNKVVKLVKLHMRPHFLVKASIKAYRRFIRDCDDMLNDVLDLAEADSLGRLPVRNFIPEIRLKVEEVKAMPVKVKKTAILNGNEIMEALGIGPGKKVGEVTKFLIDLEDTFVEEGLVLTKEDAIEKIKGCLNLPVS